MKKRSFLALLLSFMMIMVMTPIVTKAQETAEIVTLPEGINSESFGEGKTVYYDGNYYDTLANALTAVYMSTPSEIAILYCKPGADVGSMTHGHVADDLIIYGNGAYVSGGEYDMEIDTYAYDRSTGKQDQYGTFLDKEITVTVKDLDGIAAWGQRNTDYTVHLNFENCQNMNRIYFTNTVNQKGILNISLVGCSFDATKGSNPNTAFYTNAPGEISLIDTHFNHISVGMNINHKSSGVQNILLQNCTFTDCALSDSPQAASTKTYAAPIRIVAKDTAETNLTVRDVSFIYSEGKTNCGNGDILLGDGRYDAAATQGITTLEMSGTAAEVMLQQAGYYTDSAGTEELINKEKAVVSTVEKDGVTTMDKDQHFIVDNHDVSEIVNAKEATCTTEGYTGDKICTQCGKILEKGQVIAKLGHNYENGVCTICGGKDPNYVIFVPEIIKGKDGVWQQGSKDGLSFISNAEYNDFVKVLVNGKEVESKYYTVKEGSTIVTLQPSFLGTLKEGTYELAIVSTTGSAETQFTIVKATTVQPEEQPDTATENSKEENAVDTGVNDPAGIFAFAALLALGCTAAFALKKESE